MRGVVNGVHNAAQTTTLPLGFLFWPNAARERGASTSEPRNTLLLLVDLVAALVMIAARTGHRSSAVYRTVMVHHGVLCHYNKR